MNFLNPWLFALGAGLVSVPILIHLLNRRRFRIKDWAAMQFLLESLRRNRRRLKLEELILLALRCLLILLLAGAIGRMSCARQNPLPAGATPDNVVYVLDDSYSMGQTVANRTLFARATADLASMVKETATRSYMTILRASEPDANGAVYRPAEGVAVDPNRLAQRIEALKPSDRRADLERALAAAGDLLAGRDGTKQVFLLSDFRRGDLRAEGDPESPLAELAGQFADQDVQLSLLDYGRPPKNNLTIEGFDLLDRFATAGTPTRLRVTVRNNALIPTADVAVKVSARTLADANRPAMDVTLPVAEIDAIEPGQTGQVEVRYTPTHDGAVHLTAELAADELAGDNAAHMVVDVRPSIRVLVVDGSPDVAKPWKAASHFFVKALAPRGKGLYGFAPEVVTYDGLATVDFSRFDAVAILDLATFPPGAAAETPYPQLAALEAFVRNGGGLVYYTGEKVDTRFHNEYLWKRGEGLSPYRILTSVGGGDRSTFFRLDPESLDTSSFLDVYSGRGSALAGLIRFWKFTRVDELTRSATTQDAGIPRVLARFNDEKNSPAIARRSFGEGTVVTVYSSASIDWNDWAVEPVGTYVTVVTEMLRDVARPRPARSAPLLAPIIRPLPRERATDTALLRRPDYPSEPEVSLRPTVVDGRPRLVYEDTDRIGAYDIEITTALGTTDRAVYVRNGDPREGRLDPAGQEGLAVALDEADYAYAAMTGDGAGRLERTVTPSRQLWRWLIALMIAFAALEMILARRFGHYATRTNEVAVETASWPRRGQEGRA